MKNAIARYREQAFQRQSHRCCYCGFLMWNEKDAGAFRSRHVTLTGKQADDLKCTAEHIIARCDGGTDAAHNIAAACLRCNRGRHARAKPLPADEFARLVKHRIQQGKWHSLNDQARSLLRG